MSLHIQQQPNTTQPCGAMDQQQHNLPQITNLHVTVQEQDHDFSLKTLFQHVNDNNNLVKDVVVTPSSSSSVSNDSNGHINGSSLYKEEEVEEKENVDNYGSDFGEDCVSDGLRVAPEFVGKVDATFDGDNLLQNENSVYYDKQQGDKVNGLNSVQNGDAINHEESKFAGDKVNGLNGVQNGDAINHEESKFAGDKVNGLNVIQNGDATNHEESKFAGDKVPSGSELSSDIQTTPAKTENNSINEIEQEEKEFDVELVIAKQDTHDLFCPNCKSCITKRVIIKKRKRNTPIFDNKYRYRHGTEVVDNDTVSITTHEVNRDDYANVISEITNVDPPAADADDDHPDKDVEVFRCLSCFSVFFPSGKGFNLFRSKHKTSQNPSNISNSNPNWFFSLFTPNQNKAKTVTEQAGDTSDEPSRTGSADLHQSEIAPTIVTSSDIGHPETPLADAAPVKNLKPTSDVNQEHGRKKSPISSNGAQSVWQNMTSVDTKNTNTVEVKSSTNFSNGTVSEYSSVQSVTTNSSETFVTSRETPKGSHYQEKTQFSFPTSATVASLIVENSPKDANKMPQIVKNDHSLLLPQSFDSTSYEIDTLFPPKANIILNGKVPKEIDEKKNNSVSKENEGDVNHVIDFGGEEIEPATLQGEENVPMDGVIGTESQTGVVIGEQPRNEIVEPKKWEIVKSIVYGGLVESITSLGIVSSAASSGATPLNIIALGFANLIGGLFILGHNLNDMRNEHSRGQQLQTNVKDRYQELLGSRANFVFHAVIAVFSFIIFGSVPLVIYAILINKNYYDEVKLAIVAATSVACIILLTIGKVYTTRPPKSYIKTVLYYVTMAVATSGISFIAGKLVKDLLEKLNQSESGFALTMPVSDTMETAWMSY